MANSRSWEKIFTDYDMANHDFATEPFLITAKQIKASCQSFTSTSEKEVRLLCKQDTREQRPAIFAQHDLFLLPVTNGEYAIIRGEGYFDIPEITSLIKDYDSKLDFRLESAEVGNSEMQHLDFAYASSLIRSCMRDESLVLTIRGRKYTPPFDFRVGGQIIKVESVQTEIDAGYEGRDKIVLIEAKNASTSNTIIRQLFYPFRQWQTQTKKEIFLLFFEKRRMDYLIWQYRFRDTFDYNSLELVKSDRYKILGPNSI
jgi:hypothetical protein